MRTLIATCALLSAVIVSVAFHTKSPPPLPPASAVDGAQLAKLNQKLDEIADYYTFALEPSRVAENGECILVTVTTTSSRLCARHSGVDVERVDDGVHEHSPALLTAIVLDEAVLQRRWQEIANINKFRDSIRSVSSYIGLARFVRLFRFGEPTWRAYLASRGDDLGRHGPDSDGSGVPLSTVM